jgi:uncharacterized membrane protein
VKSVKEILKKLTNTKTVLAIVASIVLILQTLGINVDSDSINQIVTAFCSILVLLGIMNNGGMEDTKWDK